LGERIKAKRRELGLSIDEAAQRIGVDEGTLGRGERDEWKPKRASESLDRFFEMVPLPCV
jgi:transcriptional regulator with XRE-family HTH domain